MDFISRTYKIVQVINQVICVHREGVKYDYSVKHPGFYLFTSISKPPGRQDSKFMFNP